MSDTAINPIQEDKFDRLLNDTLISQSEIENMQVSETGKTLRDTLFSLGGPWGEMIKTLFELNDKIDDKIKERKKEYLILRLYENSNQNEEFIRKFKQYLVNPQFSILFNKLIRILNDSTDNKAYIDKLSLVLKKIIESRDFSAQFEGYKYILDQIEKLSPQAIIILADFPNWPKFSLESPYEVSATGIVTSEWIMDFVNTYALLRNIHSVHRLRTTIGELQRINAIYCSPTTAQGPITYGSIQEEKIEARCSITGFGEEIAVYLTKQK